jgi:hypothetical protein
LLRNLMGHLGRRVESVLRPIMFANLPRRGSGLRDGSFRDSGFMFMAFLHDENTAKTGHDKDYDSGSHGTNQSRVRATSGLVAARMG